MITLDHIQTYKRFDGDIDGWARMKMPEDTMTSKTWLAIDDILQNLTLINNGIAADSFKNQTLEHIKSVSQNEEVVQALLNLSKNAAHDARSPLSLMNEYMPAEKRSLKDRILGTLKRFLGIN